MTCDNDWIIVLNSFRRENKSNVGKLINNYISLVKQMLNLSLSYQTFIIIVSIRIVTFTLRNQLIKLKITMIFSNLSQLSDLGSKLLFPNSS